MAIHSQKDIDELVGHLLERQAKLVAAMRGKATERLTSAGFKPGVTVKAADILLAVDDVAAVLKRVKSRLGKD